VYILWVVAESAAINSLQQHTATRDMASNSLQQHTATKHSKTWQLTHAEGAKCAHNLHQTSLLQCVAACCSVLQCVAICCKCTQLASDVHSLPPSTHCNIHTRLAEYTLQHTATHCNKILQHTATHCNTLQHTHTTR